MITELRVALKIYLASIAIVVILSTLTRLALISRRVVSSLLAPSLIVSFFVALHLPSPSSSDFHFLLTAFWSNASRDRWLLERIGASALAAALLYALIGNRLIRSKTIRRKPFHLLGALVYFCGAIVDPIGLACASLALFLVFLLADYCRVERLPWLSPLVESVLRSFDDTGRSGGAFVWAHYSLLVSLSAPLFVELVNGGARVHIAALAGVVSVGVGDSMASLVGSVFGRHRWSESTRKTIEGSAAMFLSQLALLLVVSMTLCAEASPISALVASAVLSTFAEAVAARHDNELTTLVMYLALRSMISSTAILQRRPLLARARVRTDIFSVFD